MPSKKWLSIQEIAPLFHRPIVDVAGAPPPIENLVTLWGAVAAHLPPTHPLLSPAATLGVCTTVLKKVCRRHGIRRWPQRKLQSLNKLINNLHNAMKSTNGAARSPLLPAADARSPRVRHTPPGVEAAPAHERPPLAPPPEQLRRSTSASPARSLTCRRARQPQP